MCTHTITFCLKKNSIAVEYPKRRTTDISAIRQIGNCPSLRADYTYIRIGVMAISYKFKSEPFTVRRPFIVKATAGVIPCRTICHLTYLFRFQVKHHQSVAVFNKSQFLSVR